MPIIKSAKKRNKQNKVRRERNLATQSAYQKVKKKFSKAIDLKEADTASSLISSVYRKLAMAIKKKVLSPAKAARYMSQSAKALKSVGGKMPVGSVVEKTEEPKKVKKAPKKAPAKAKKKASEAK